MKKNKKKRVYKKKKISKAPLKTKKKVKKINKASKFASNIKKKVKKKKKILHQSL